MTKHARPGVMPGRALQVLLFSIPELIYVDNLAAASGLMEPTQQRRLLGLATPVLVQSPQEGCCPGQERKPHQSPPQAHRQRLMAVVPIAEQCGHHNAYSSGIVRRRTDAKRNRIDRNKTPKQRTADNILTALLLRFVRC